MKELVGLILFFVITIVYFGVAVSVQLKWSRRMKESGERFREEAERDGRKVTAYLDNYIDEYTDGEHGYAADYYYTAPMGNGIKCGMWTAIFRFRPARSEPFTCIREITASIIVGIWIWDSIPACL